MWLALALYAAVVALLAYVQPAFLVGPDGAWKHAALGTSDTQSVFGAAIVLPIAAVLCYYTASVATAF